MTKTAHRLAALAAALPLAAPAAVAGHVTLTDTIASSNIYPGTVHTLTVSVPDAYDPSRPACLYLGLDGELCSAPDVIDSLMAAGKMPVTIGVYLQPGVVRDEADGHVLRYNRSNEFDATTCTFATFLESEVLPSVERLVTPDGRRVRLSPSGQDRMIFGLSSGGIAAFVAAWHRPDMFSRVFSGCGTFVAMRGGSELQALVRKSEPRALRVFLQDGYSDAWNPLFGHWYEGNRLLASALEFAGCDCRFDWAEGGHSVRRASEIFASVMQWMWHDYPAPVQAGTTGNDFLRPLLTAGATWQPCQAEPQPATPGRATYPDSSLMAEWDGTAACCIMQYTRSAATGQWHNGQRFYWLHSAGVERLEVAGMAFDGAGNLWVLTNAGLQVCDQNGRVRAILSLPSRQWLGGAVVIADGLVTLPAYGQSRRLGVTAPRPGVRPKSQGQG